MIRFKKDNMRLSKLEIDEVSLVVKILENQPHCEGVPRPPGNAKQERGDASKKLIFGTSNAPFDQNDGNNVEHTGATDLGQFRPI